MRLHRGGRFRAWLGARLGGDVALGDRAWRRILHCLGVGVLFYYILPPGFFLVITVEQALLLALAVMLVLEALRHLVGLELPTVRPFEQGRVASFAYFAIALVLAVLLFPKPVGIAVAAGTALIDPLIGELRLSARFRPLYPELPIAAYAVLAGSAFALTSGWSVLEVGLLAVVGAGVAVAAEHPKSRWVDDDLAMTIAPAIVLTVLALAWP